MLRLRPYKTCDAKAIVTWTDNERDFRKWSADRYDHYPISAADMNSYYAQFADKDDHFEMTAFDESGIVGHLIMRFIDENKSNLHFGFVIIDPAKRGKGYGKQMLELAIKYGFEILKADKITLGVYANNPGAIKCYKAVGFKETDTDKEEYFRVFNEDWKRISMEIVK